MSLCRCGRNLAANPWRLANKSCQRSHSRTGQSDGTASHRVQISTTSTSSRTSKLTVRRKQHAACCLPICHAFCPSANVVMAAIKTPLRLAAGPLPPLCPPLRHSRVWDHILTACQNMLQLTPVPLSGLPLEVYCTRILSRDPFRFAPLPSLAGISVARRKEPQVYDVICSFMRHTNKVA